MIIIFETIFGSHLYGTNTPESDVDIKGVYLPDHRDILLGEVKPVISYNTKKDNKSGVQVKNKPNDIDKEYFSLDKFIDLAAQGQTVALDILFATNFIMEEGVNHLENGYVGNKHGYYNHVWFDLWTNRDKFASKQCQSFLGYCRKQSNKYGIKGSRVASVRQIVSHLEKWYRITPVSKLGDYESQLKLITNNFDHMQVVDIPINSKGDLLKHLEVCDRKAPYTISLKDALALYTRLLKNYGTRALMAEKNKGVDWKALHHAVRIGRQACEYLDTGHITFPSPKVEELLAIKQGKIPYKDVEKSIEDLFVQIEEASNNSSFPKKPDVAWMADFIVKHYREVVANG